MDPLNPADCGRLFCGALLVLAAEVFVSFGFFFAPGWANGWPGGLTIYQVWSTWLTITLFVMMMTVGVSAGSLVSLVACVFPAARRHTRKVLTAWMVGCGILSTAACAWAFRGIYASTLQMWPHGYPG
jgi:hypothetical protein